MIIWWPHALVASKKQTAEYKLRANKLFNNKLLRKHIWKLLELIWTAKIEKLGIHKKRKFDIESLNIDTSTHKQRDI